MLEIGKFFERWKNKELGEMAFFSAVTGAVKDMVGYDLDVKQISYSNGILFINIPPAAKSALFIKKKDLIKKINEKIDRKVLDMR